MTSDSRHPKAVPDKRVELLLCRRDESVHSFYLRILEAQKRAQARKQQERPPPPDETTSYWLR